MLHNVMLSLIEQRLKHHNLPLNVEYSDGRKLAVADTPRIRVIAHSIDALKKLAEPTMGGIAEAYVKGDIDIAGPIRELVAIADRYCEADAAVTIGSAATTSGQAHSRETDRASISHHYDVSNDFYGLWLDRNRVYSCGYFRQTDDSLDAAQEQKLDHICRKLRLQAGERFLDIGCGWGGLILRAAERYGVFATGITLSHNQYAYVQEQIRARGLGQRVQVHLLDYRDVGEGQPFDKIASVGMFEHVGRQNMPTYFAKIQRLLKPGGLVLNHGITSSSLTRDGLGSDISEFVDRYVFPNGELIHIAHVMEFMAAAGLDIRDVESLRPHYATTLWHWVSNLEQHAEAARKMVGEERYRIWRIYMAGSAWGFERNWMSLYQVLAGRPCEDGSLPLPLTRADIYG